MADGLSYNEAYNKAHVDIMTDLLEDALGGFISGGLMTGGNYASMGLTTTAGKVVSGIRNTRDIYTGANLVGMGEDVKAACDFRLSFSPMTFPHTMMRVILAEQLYRALTILHNGRYHK